MPSFVLNSCSIKPGTLSRFFGSVVCQIIGSTFGCIKVLTGGDLGFRNPWVATICTPARRSPVNR
ncbi:hypothetical protein [Ponticoccus alexandrii]|uniref:Uncharacterized protein n=1 Tax=Ponticoccus alexandrii TaxID=1943633 RepID=A0ABX7F795_9RHOB|nr:hypothetical protein [Ponticoccus alexandrii]QRF66393.1 hypothetical protein GQA70_08765 [Ponticoccus alexandrii]